MKGIDLIPNRREYVANYPAGVLAFRFTASKKGKLNAKISLNRSQGVQSQTSSSSGGSGSIVLKVNSGSIPFTSEARIFNDGGKLFDPLDD